MRLDVLRELHGRENGGGCLHTGFAVLTWADAKCWQGRELGAATGIAAQHGGPGRPATNLPSLTEIRTAMTAAGLTPG